jgi:agmatine deiminase
MPERNWLTLIFLIVAVAMSPVLLKADQALPGDQLQNYGRFTETPPPEGSVRPIAEFEPASHVMIRWPLGIPLSLVAQLANTARVICLVSSTSEQNSATSSFNNAGVNMAKVDFLTAATDSYWTRDYGPWFIFDGNGDYGVVDFRYNRPRPNDNLIPQVFANQLGLDYYGMNLHQTGGNYMCDGIGTAAQTTIAYTENPSLTQTQVAQKMHDYLGIENFHVLPDPNDTYINHIDCWGKFLAPDKVLIRSVPSNHAQYDEIEQTAAFFASTNCAWGYPYRVYRVNTPQNQPYTNSLILNKRVFVPIMNSTYDAAALQVYQNAMPGYEIIGVTGSGYTPWESTDALHCRTHEIPDQHMLEIRHQPLHGQFEISPTWEFNAELIAHSGQALITDSLFIAYKVNQGIWQTALLAYNSGNGYGATLSGFAPGDTIRYYLHAADQSGRATDHPLFAALDPHVFVISGDTEAPIIMHNPPTSITSGNHIFSVTVSDNVSVSAVCLRYKTDDSPITEIPMLTDPEGPPNYWWAEADLQFEAGSEFFHYQIEARDSANPANIATYPFPGEWLNIPIDLVSISDDNIPQPEHYSLWTYPNPYHIGSTAYLTIECKDVVNYTPMLNIFNSRGQLVYYESGPVSSSDGVKFLWDGLDIWGRKTAPGIYFIRVDANAITLSSKVLIME